MECLQIIPKKAQSPKQDLEIIENCIISGAKVSRNRCKKKNKKKG